MSTTCRPPEMIPQRCIVQTRCRLKAGLVRRLTNHDPKLAGRPKLAASHTNITHPAAFRRQLLHKPCLLVAIGRRPGHNVRDPACSEAPQLAVHRRSGCRCRGRAGPSAPRCARVGGAGSGRHTAHTARPELARLVLAHSTVERCCNCRALVARAYPQRPVRQRAAQHRRAPPATKLAHRQPLNRFRQPNHCIIALLRHRQHIPRA